MLYALDANELVGLWRARVVPRMDGAEMLSVLYRTDADVVRRILPPPLEPVPDPLALVYVARFEHTNFGVAYGEAGLALACRLGRTVGFYPVFMPVDDDTALVAGREIYGFPKKLAERITLTRVGDDVEARVVRRGHELLHLRGSVLGHAAPGDLDGFAPAHAGERRLRAFLTKYSVAPSTRALDLWPRLVEQETLVRPCEAPRTVAVTVRLGTSPIDPLDLLPVHEVRTAVVGRYDLTLQPGRVVRRMWRIWRVLPRLLFKNEVVTELLARSDEARADDPGDG